MTQAHKLAEILLVEDNIGDIELTRAAFSEAKVRNNLHIAMDGDEALDILFKRNGKEDAVTPDIILLDLNLPGTDGHEVLQEVKGDVSLKHIPVAILTSSNAEKDIVASYELNANCYVVKPMDTVKLVDVVQQIENFGVDITCLPPMT